MNILLITPPLTQPNTPYPATAYLTGFLKQYNHEIHQVDLGIELINKIFTRESLTRIFELAEPVFERKASKNIRQIFTYQQDYIHTIEAVMRFLRGEDLTLATRICSGNFLPEGSRFASVTDLDWAFGNLGLTDKARHLATLYIEDLTDFIRETINPYFELGRYAEKISMFASSFTPLDQSLSAPTNYIDQLMINILEEKISCWIPEMIGFTIPFPGNLYGALKCGKYIKEKYAKISVVWGGGYVNTELRNLTEPKVFDYTDYILLDDGECGLLRLIEFIEHKILANDLIRTFVRDESGEVILHGNESFDRIFFDDCGTPDYTDLKLNTYISLIEVANPMHKLWSDGRWNKLTLAHGCYWAKCAFCDTSLPYIANYEPLSATIIADRIEQIIIQTHTTGFHFVDEAAPPKLLRELSQEILKRKISISWWTNIRFEKAFDKELCTLMSKAGCIAVSGGIEVASNRLLKLINKGVTIEQAAKSSYHLTYAGIMVHAYLMYGFPTETEQESIDSLEIVRQFFENNLLQSAFWHRYAMTVHSPSGIDPAKFGATLLSSEKGDFANNEIAFTDRQDIDLSVLGEGLRKAVYNYMHGIGIDWHVSKWFAKKVPGSIIPKNYIRNSLKSGN